MWLLAPLKERWCPHHILRLFCLFANLMWNSSMASWACSILDSFTQDASIWWYPLHLTKYSYSRPLSCLDLSTVVTPLWVKCEHETHTPKSGNLESSRTPKNFELDFRGQNTLHWNVLCTIGKVLKYRCPKWPRMSHMDIFSTSYGRKKVQESNWQFVSQPHFGLNVRVKLTLPKVGTWSLLGLPKT
jgi:hypothetical protein